MNDDASNPAVRISCSNGIGEIELCRPRVHNCLTRSMLRTIAGTITSFEQDPEVRVVLVVAAGRNFCTGAQLGEVDEVRGDEREMRDLLDAAHGTLNQMEASPLPIVCAVQGFCLAGGLELALACDVVIASEDALFGDQHVTYGLVPGWGGTQRLPRAIGLQRTLHLMFSGQRIDAATALGWGLASEVVPMAYLRNAARAYAATLTTRSSSGLTAMKRLARSADLGPGLRAEKEEIVRLLRGADMKEGLAAFRLRRQPVFGPRDVERGGSNSNVEAAIDRYHVAGDR